MLSNCQYFKIIMINLPNFTKKKDCWFPPPIKVYTLKLNSIKIYTVIRYLENVI